jgi:hypothetical protein
MQIQILTQAIYHLFNTCPYAGRYLGDSYAMENPLPIRQKQYFIGLLIPCSTHIRTDVKPAEAPEWPVWRLRSSSNTDDELLPFLRIAINQLNAS